MTDFGPSAPIASGTATTRPSVFLSYNSRDSAIIKEVVRVLDMLEIDCYFDPSRNTLGDIDDTLAREIVSRDLFVVFAGANKFGRVHEKEFRHAAQHVSDRRVAVELPGFRADPNELIDTDFNSVTKLFWHQGGPVPDTVSGNDKITIAKMITERAKEARSLRLASGRNAADRSRSDESPATPGRAMLIGVANYTARWTDGDGQPAAWDPTTADADVETMREVLAGWSIEPVACPTTRADFATVTDRFLRSGQRDETLLLYYSGHGFTPEDQSDRFFLCPETSSRDPYLVEDTNLSFTLLARSINESPAGSVVVILDCCDVVETVPLNDRVAMFWGESVSAERGGVFTQRFDEAIRDLCQSGGAVTTGAIRDRLGADVGTAGTRVNARFAPHIQLVLDPSEPPRPAPPVEAPTASVLLHLEHGILAVDRLNGPIAAPDDTLIELTEPAIELITQLHLLIDSALGLEGSERCEEAALRASTTSARSLGRALGIHAADDSDRISRVQLQFGAGAGADALRRLPWEQLTGSGAGDDLLIERSCRALAAGQVERAAKGPDKAVLIAALPSADSMHPLSRAAYRGLKSAAMLRAEIPEESSDWTLCQQHLSLNAGILILHTKFAFGSDGAVILRFPREKSDEEKGDKEVTAEAFRSLVRTNSQLRYIIVETVAPECGALRVFVHDLAAEVDADVVALTYGQRCVLELAPRTDSEPEFPVLFSTLVARGLKRGSTDFSTLIRDARAAVMNKIADTRSRLVVGAPIVYRLRTESTPIPANTATSNPMPRAAASGRPARGGLV